MRSPVFKASLNKSYLLELTSIISSDVYKRQASEYANTGKTPMYVVIDGRLAGIVCVADTIKETLSLIHIS